MKLVIQPINGFVAIYCTGIAHIVYNFIFDGA